MAGGRMMARSVSMNVVPDLGPGGGLKAPPGMKPGPDGKFKKAGEFLSEYLLENENGSKAIVDTETCTCISWKDASGKELIKKDGTAHWLNGAPVKGHFIPEERAKKLTFDRMIFKCNPEDMPEVEYRVDVTMRADSLEYDVILINTAGAVKKLEPWLKVNGDGSKITEIKGYTSQDGNIAKGAAFDAPVGKFKETKFYAKVLKA